MHIPFSRYVEITPIAPTRAARRASRTYTRAYSIWSAKPRHSNIVNRVSGGGGKFSIGYSVAAGCGGTGVGRPSGRTLG